MNKLENWDDLGVARVHLNLSQQQMSEAIGVCFRTYQNWERHISKPTNFVQIEIMARVSKMLEKVEEIKK